MTTPNQSLIHVIANLVSAYHLAIPKSYERYDIRDNISDLCNRFMPHGSGFDSGTKLNLERSTADKLVFITEFHHLNPNGYYDGWTEHNVTAKASFLGTATWTVSGQNRNDIKDYIVDSFITALETRVTYDKGTKRYVLA